jgi:hypothetical protein
MRVRIIAHDEKKNGGFAMRCVLQGALFLLGTCLTANAQVLDRVSLSDELAAPFSFFLSSSDVVGFKDCPEGFQLVNDGSLISSFGQFTVLAGDPPRACDARVKTLQRGYLPVFEYGFQRDGIAYRFRAWGMPADLDPREDLIAFVQVTATNTGREAATAQLQAGFGPVRPAGHAVFPCTPWYRDRFMTSASFKAEAAAQVSEGLVMKAGHLVFAYSGDCRTQATADGVACTVNLSPGEERTVTLKVPYVPISEAKADAIGQVRQADPTEARQAIVRFWEDLLGQAVSIELPEAKVIDTVRAGLVYLLCARDVDETGRRFVQKVNEFQYDDFFPRDSAYIIRTYDLYGLHKIARETLESFLVRGEDGAVQQLRRMKQHPDDWGQSLWALGSYYRINAEGSLAKEVLPGIAPHLDNFEESLKSDPSGLWPVAPPYDNELIDGHYTGHNFWAVLGLSEAENLAKGAGDMALASRAARLREAFLPVLMGRMEAMTAKTEGYIPPGLDDPDAGYDWENATGGVYPFGVMGPDHPWAKATVETAREYKWREGISTWGPNAWHLKQKARHGAEANPGSMHHYQTFNVAETMLAMGRQREVLEDLYSVLAHTSSTNAGFELGMDAWGGRDPGGNYPPHGWFAARYCELVRNMLVREEGDALHLASALSPWWVRPGDVIRVTGAPTAFGQFSMEIKSKADGAEITVSPDWRTPPKSMIFHIPWFTAVASAEIDGEAAAVVDGRIELPSSAHRCTLKWQWQERPDLSYARAVYLWLSKNYESRPETDRNFLFPRPTQPKLAGVQRIFTDEYILSLLSPRPSAEVRYTLDGSVPTPRSSLYEGPVAIRQTTVVKAVEVWPDGRISAPLETTIRKVPYRVADVPRDRAAELEPGIEVSVYDGVFKTLPDFSQARPNRTGKAASLELSAAGKQNEYAVHFVGYLRVPTDGVYSITVGSDDGSQLRVGDELLIDNDGLHVYTEVSGQMALKAGFHAISLGFFDAGGAAHLRVFWQGPNRPREKLGAEALFRKKARE